MVHSQRACQLCEPAGTHGRGQEDARLTDAACMRHERLVYLDLLAILGEWLATTVGDPDARAFRENDHLEDGVR